MNEANCLTQVGAAFGGQIIDGPQQVDPFDEIRAAARFLKWCETNNKPTELAQEWLISEARKLA